jgi:hypothetical protein
MDAHEPATGGDELEKVLPAMRLGDGAPNIVIEEDGVELTEGSLFEHGGIFADRGDKRPSPFTMPLESLAAGEDRPPVTVIFDITVEDQQAPGLRWRRRLFRRQSLLDALPALVTEDGPNNTLRLRHFLGIPWHGGPNKAGDGKKEATAKMGA